MHNVHAQTICHILVHLQGPSSENVQYSVTGPTACNSLPYDSHKITVTNTFKCHLKFYFFNHYFCIQAFSALTLLVGWQEGHLACKKTEWWGAGMVTFPEVDLHMAQLMPLPLTVSCYSKI